MKRQRTGFSLLEVTVVIFVMGLTITALLQMFELGHLRYNSIAQGFESRTNLTELRIWLRDKVARAEIDQITLDNIEREMNFSGQFKLTDLKINNYDQETFFISLMLFEDRNLNNSVDKSENSVQRLYCFRRRST
ncbi:MAG: hypothetical protein PWR01_3090 [Clostridiales bacterium]|jgi:lipopolysaccharide export LptBFGC system permease protein LptF|nr:hypothetical protein [Clostridiales bacterium]MDN5282017.1 hypothetical protein [Candidatus Ozemobacter sp.]